MSEQLLKMDKNENMQVYKIIKKYSDQFTKKEDGYMINANNLNDTCLEEIEKYILFSIELRKRMDEDLQQRKTYERLIHK